MEKLKPCPFCGGAVGLAKVGYGYATHIWIITRGVYKRKRNCNCRLWMESEPFYSDGKKEKVALVEAWNRRSEE